jgi:hypothetical protein
MKQNINPLADMLEKLAFNWNMPNGNQYHVCLVTRSNYNCQQDKMETQDFWLVVEAPKPIQTRIHEAIQNYLNVSMRLIN